MTSVEKRRQMTVLENLTEPLLSGIDRVDFQQGIVLFNNKLFWESHEAWEQVWKRHAQNNRIFFQGMIQIAAGMHQLQRQIPHGVEKHFRNAQWKLKPFAPVCLGLDVTYLLEALDAGLKELFRLGPRKIGELKGTFQIHIDQAKSSPE